MCPNSLGEQAYAKVTDSGKEVKRNDIIPKQTIRGIVPANWYSHLETIILRKIGGQGGWQDLTFYFNGSNLGGADLRQAADGDKEVKKTVTINS